MAEDVTGVVIDGVRYPLVVLGGTTTADGSSAGLVKIADAPAQAHTVTLDGDLSVAAAGVMGEFTDITPYNVLMLV